MKGQDHSKERGSSMKNRKGDNKKKRELKAGQRKKGAPKWKNVQAEVESILKRIETEVPPSGVLYYKYKQGAEGKSPYSTVLSNRKIVETSDKV
jgi:hypothetical protein